MNKPTTINYPCNYPITVVGFADPNLCDFVKSVVKKHYHNFDGTTKIKWSKNKNFQSISFSIEAQNEKQIKDIFDDLKKNDKVQIVI